MSHAGSRIAGAAVVALAAIPVAQIATGPQPASPATPALTAAFVTAGHGRFVTPGPGGSTIGIAPDRLALRTRQGFAQLRLLGADRAARAVPAGRLPGVVNVLRGATHRTGLSRWARVRYRDVWPGIDAVYHGLGGGLEYDFALRPGADPARIALRLDGRLPQHAPRAFQTIGGRRVEVPVAFRAHRGRIGVELGAYDHTLPLLIDPTVAFSTFLGGSAGDQASGVAADSAGNVIVVGEAHSTNFPTRSPLQASKAGSSDATISKFSPSGQLVWSTYLGGTGTDIGWGVAVGPNDSLVVAGQTTSTDFPGTQPTFGGVEDAFVSKLGSDGSLQWSTYLGGSDDDIAESVAVDGSGAITVAGQTKSPNFPHNGGVQTTYGGNQDGFVTRLQPSGTATWSTYLGGNQADELNHVLTTPTGETWVVGDSLSPDYPTAGAGADNTRGGSQDGVVSRISADGSSLQYSSYYGGGQADMIFGAALDSAQNLHLVGTTASGDLPGVDPGQTLGGGIFDAFVTELSPAGAPTWATYLGGAGGDYATAVVIDPSGNTDVAGYSNSTDLPVTSGSPPAGDSDAMLASYAPDRSRRWLMAIHASGDQALFSTLAIDGVGALTIAGYTPASDFPTTSGAFQPTYGGGPYDMFVQRLLPDAAVSAPGVDFGQAAIGASVDRTATITNSGTDPLVVASAGIGGSAAGDYAVTANGCGTVQPGASCTVGVRFTPSAAGARAATLDLTTNASVSPQQVSLTGSGPTPSSPATPTPKPKPDVPLPLACNGASVAILDVHREGGRIHVSGLTLSANAGKAVTVGARPGKAKASSKVAPDGSFAVTLKPPKGSAARVSYQATVAGHTSTALHLDRRFVLSTVKATGAGLIVRGHVARGKKGQKVAVRKQVSCKTTRPVSTVRLRGGGTFSVTLPKPTGGAAFAFYRASTKIGKFKTFTLPIVVRAAG